ncbi:hypothetical protein J4558_04445 [Leptolyngbya sp. 15MV]|nr:hypothetical protein J4558_04445 [Leptolyngbya sp. 15MV]
MKQVAVFLALVALASSSVTAQPVRKETDVAKQRAAVEAWTACIADENVDRVSRTLARDFTSREYRSEMLALAKTRVSSRCFEAMPGEYRRIELGGLPFAGGLAERLIERSDESLLLRLSRAVIGVTPQTYSPTDAIAMCMVRGAPLQVSSLFGTSINSSEEIAALADLASAVDICSVGTRRLEASPLGMRSMLATASFRLLAAQEG